MPVCRCHDGGYLWNGRTYGLLFRPKALTTA